MRILPIYTVPIILTQVKNKFLIKEIYNRKLTNFPCSANKEENRYSSYLIAKHHSDYTALLSDEEYIDLLKGHNPISTPEDDREFFYNLKHTNKL